MKDYSIGQQQTIAMIESPLKVETPSQGRAKIFKNGEAVNIQIPTRKNWPLIIFLSVWLSMWVTGESFAIGALVNDEIPFFANTFLLIWLTAWTGGGAFVAIILLWSLAGEEIVRVDRGVLEIGRQIFSLKKSKRYSIEEIRHLSINPTADNDFWGFGYQRNLFGLRGGVLKFDYGMKTLKFAAGIDEAEGRMLLDVLKVNPQFRDANFAT